MDVPVSSAREEAPDAPRTPAPVPARPQGPANGAARGERVDLERELASVGRRTWTRRLVIVGVIVALVGGGLVWRARPGRRRRRAT